MNRQYRQGDVLLCAVEEIPRDARPVTPAGERVVVAQGELTRHAHAFGAGAAQMFRDEQSGRAFLRIGEGGEHALIPPKGQYELRRQREYA